MFTFVFICKTVVDMGKHKLFGLKGIINQNLIKAERSSAEVFEHCVLWQPTATELNGNYP